MILPPCHVSRIVGGKKLLQREQTMLVSPFPTPAFFSLRRLCAVCSLLQLYEVGIQAKAGPLVC